RGLEAERGHHLGKPRERVGVARAVLGVAVEREVGEDEPEAVAEVLDDRLPLLVAEERRVQEHEARPRAGLPVGDARAVAMVEEAELHPVASPARMPRTSASATGAAPVSTTTRAELSTRRCSSAWIPAVRFAP